MSHLDYKKVEKVHGANSRAVYRQIAEITGGDPDPNHEGGLDLTGLSEADQKKVDDLMTPAKPAKK